MIITCRRRRVTKRACRKARISIWLVLLWIWVLRLVRGGIKRSICFFMFFVLMD